LYPILGDQGTVLNCTILTTARTSVDKKSPPNDCAWNVHVRCWLSRKRCSLSPLLMLLLLFNI